VHEELSRVAEKALDSLLLSSRAQLLTCYFLNPYSGVYWLFYKASESGESFIYPWQLHGPLTHPDQRIRFDCAGDKSFRHEYVVADLFETLPTELTQNVLAGTSFARREGIQQVIRLTIEEKIPNANHQVPLSRKAIVFLSYRKRRQGGLVQLEAALRPKYALLRTLLLELVEQPNLSDRQAWLLRSANIQILDKLAVPLAGEAHVRRIYDLITNEIFRIIRPRNGKNLQCTLMRLNRDNELVPVSSRSIYTPRSRKPGVVRYVSITGQMFYIPDTQKYKRRFHQTRESTPQYIEWDPNKRTRSELDCPLIIQERVVGVLNLEADATDAYDESHVMMLYHFATMASLAIRHICLWDELRVAIAHQHALMSINKEEQAIVETLKNIVNLGFSHARIWDDTLRCWFSENGADKNIALPRFSNDPKGRGYTALILERRTSVAVADLRVDDNRNLTSYQARTGIMDPDSLLFQAWESPDKAMETRDPSPVVIAWTAENQDADDRTTWSTVPATFIGLPIFVGQSRGNPAVQGVLWIRCRRYFRSITDDECWFLSLLCRNLGEALASLRPRLKKEEEEKLFVLRQHFDNDRALNILDVLRQNPDALLPRYLEDVIVAHLDVRHSTDLGTLLAKNKQRWGFSDFIRGYHELAFKIIFKYGGIVDKTVGDGIVAMFNLYTQKGIVLADDQRTQSDREIAMEKAVNSMLEIFEEFRRYCKKFQNETPTESLVYFPRDLRLGAALAIGGVMVGGFKANGFDYTAYGDLANKAGHLVDYARGKELRDIIEKDVDSRHIQTTIERKDIVDDERSRFLEIGLATSNSLLVTDAQFCKVKPSQEVYLSYLISLKMDSKVAEPYIVFARDSL
jgi:class 3 adenylate cyclase